MRAKHKESKEKSTPSNICLEPEIVVVETCDVGKQSETEKHDNESDTVVSETCDVGKQIACENCDFVAENEENVKTHVIEKHENESDNVVIEIKLELFTIDFDNDVLEARKNVIEKLEEQNEVEKVLKVYVDKFERFVDTNNILWRTIDIYLTTSEKAHCWKDSKFVKNIFQNCYLRKSINGHTREDLKRRKEEEEEMRSRGYYRD